MAILWQLRGLRGGYGHKMAVTGCMSRSFFAKMHAWLLRDGFNACRCGCGIRKMIACEETILALKCTCHQKIFLICERDTF